MNEYSVHAVLFVASLSDYNSVLFEDPTMNSMLESVTLFEDIVNLKEFRKSDTILILNKDDIFCQKLRQEKVSLSTCFSKEGGWPNENEYFPEKENPLMEFKTDEMFANFHTNCIHFIAGIYKSRNRNEHMDKQTYVHTTIATENKIVKKVFWDVQSIICRANMRIGGLAPESLNHLDISSPLNYTIDQDNKDDSDEKEVTVTVTNSKYNDFTLNAKQQLYDLAGNHINLEILVDNDIDHDDEKKNEDKFATETVNIDAKNKTKDIKDKNESVMSSLTAERYVNNV